MDSAFASIGNPAGIKSCEKMCKATNHKEMLEMLQATSLCQKVQNGE
jgi:hypothetical protein